jgi:hypothetical protein
LTSIVLSSRSKKRNAQTNAKTKRSSCTEAINNFDTKYGLLKAKLNKLESEKRKSDLLARLLKVKLDFSTYSSEFNSLVRGGNNPEAWLSFDEYGQIADNFEKLSKKFDGLFSIMNDIESDSLRDDEPEVKNSGDNSIGKTSFTPQTSKVEPEKPVENRQGYQEKSTTTQNSDRGYDQAIVHHTTVIHDSGSNDFNTGVILGSILADDDNHEHHHHYDRDDSDYHSNKDENNTTVGSGSEIEIGDSTDGSGSEMDLGISSDGNGSERSIFDEPEDNSSGGSESSIFDSSESDNEEEDEDKPDFGSSYDDNDDEEEQKSSNCDCDCDCDCSSDCDSSSSSD